MPMSYAPATVNTEELEQIKNLERDLGKVLVAVEPVATYASLSASELAELRETEKKLGCLMIAYEDHGL